MYKSKDGEEKCKCGWQLPDVGIELRSEAPPDLELVQIIIICPLCHTEHYGDDAIKELEEVSEPS